MSQAHPPPHRWSPDAWARAVEFATGTPEVVEALTGIVGEAVVMAGAGAGAVLEGGSGACRAAVGCEPVELEPLLREGGVVAEAMQRQEEGADQAVRLSGGEGGWAHLLLTPLRARGLAGGALLLLYPRGEPDAGASRVAGLCAGLAALVLENERLYEEGRAARQAREHFLVSLNHELRTPATALVLAADLLRSDSAAGLPPRIRDALGEIEGYVRQMGQVLRRVLDLGRLEDRQAQQRTDVLHPREVVAALLRRVEPAAKRKHLTLSLYVPRNLPPLQTDEERFSRILLHVFSNAIKYTSHGGVEVRLERTLRPVNRHRKEPVLTVRVHDTGSGIPAAEVERVFEPFTQVDEGAHTDFPLRGLGLGLPTARRMAQSLGGEMAIESAPGRGTTVTLTLPYLHSAPPG